ncbi:hypothetical protein CFC21_094503 [Triticum aestivum]|uniref:F-box domain-containing protein n=2 Tax=Triticum aestivum TaxID=4565 RepID=A0A9R1LN78_WHEAT|nr:hypothetical protein CFC21_094503 [Triticum aestivum]
METASSEIGRLPEKLLVRVISLTSPVAASHAASVSRAFRAAADSDTVWSCFVPRELPRFAKKQISPSTASKKALFRRLSCLPAFIPRKLMHMRLDKATGAKCFMLSAEILQITKYRRYQKCCSCCFLFVSFWS